MTSIDTRVCRLSYILLNSVFMIKCVRRLIGGDNRIIITFFLLEKVRQMI